MWIAAIGTIKNVAYINFNQKVETETKLWALIKSFNFIWRRKICQPKKFMLR